MRSHAHWFSKFDRRRWFPLNLYMKVCFRLIDHHEANRGWSALRRIKAHSAERHEYEARLLTLAARIASVAMPKLAAVRSLSSDRQKANL